MTNGPWLDEMNGLRSDMVVLSFANDQISYEVYYNKLVICS